MKTFLLQLILSLCIINGKVQSQDFIGRMPTTFNFNDPPSTNSSLNSSDLFINTNYVTYNATVVAWNYCYYVVNDTQDLSQTKIHAGIWRQNNSGFYELQSESRIKLRLPERHQIGTQFVCTHWKLNCSKDEPFFPVMEGDVVGVYIEGIVLVNMFEQSQDGHNEIYKVQNLPYIDMPFPNDSLMVVNNSALHFEAVIGDGTDSDDGCPNRTIPTTTVIATETTESGEMPQVQWAIPVMVVLTVLSLLLIIAVTFVAVILTCKLHNLRKRTKSSGPVLITERGITRTKKALTPATGSAHESNHLRVRGLNNGSSDNVSLNRSSPQSVRSVQPLLPPSPSPQRVQPVGQHTTVNDNASSSPVPVVFSIDGDDVQKHSQEKASLKPPLQYVRPPFTRPNKSVLLPLLDLRRSRSINDTFNMVPESDKGQLTSSSEYPYVLHAFEVVGKRLPVIGSLPADLHLLGRSTLETPTEQPNETVYSRMSREEESGDDVVYDDVHVEGDELGEADDEPSYSYASREEIVNSDGALRPCFVDLANQDYRYEEYPSEWTPSATLTHNFARQLTESDDCQSPVYQDIDDYQEIEDNPNPPSHHQSNTAASELFLDTVPQLHTDKEKNASQLLKPQPRPRKKLIQPSSRGQSDTGTSHGGAVETPQNYMKLLQTTTDEVGVYMSLAHDASDLRSNGINT